MNGTLLILSQDCRWYLRRKLASAGGTVSRHRADVDRRDLRDRSGHAAPCSRRSPGRAAGMPRVRRRTRRRGWAARRSASAARLGCAGGASWRTRDSRRGPMHAPRTISPPGGLAAHWPGLLRGRPAGHPTLAPSRGLDPVRSLSRPDRPRIGSDFFDVVAKNKDLRAMCARRPSLIRR